MKKPRRTQTKLMHDQQLELIKYHRSNPTATLSALCQWAKARFQLSKAPGISTVSDLLIRSRSDSFSTTQPDAAVTTASTMLDRELILWINKCEKFCVCITGHIIRYKAEMLRDAVVANGVPDRQRDRLLQLKFSKGWLYNFQRRHNLISRRLHGEAGSVDEVVAEEGRQLIHGIAELYEKRNIFNMDETAMYYCKAPDRTISPNPVFGRKKSKKRMTVAVTTNADGSEKLPLLFVGSARQPRCFNKSSPEQLGISYSSTSKGWMTRELFRAWVLELDANMKAEGRHILLLVDNVSSHHTDEVLTNVRIQMLPPNTTSLLQPQDAGIIASLKAWIKRKQAEHAVNKMEEIMSRATDDNEKETKKELSSIYDVDILEAMRWCSDAWDAVSQSSVSNCWKHTGILPEIMHDLIQSMTSMRVVN
jgi:hypothetical protein